MSVFGLGRKKCSKALFLLRDTQVMAKTPKEVISELEIESGPTMGQGVLVF